jgi:phage shock protein A
MQRLRIWTTSLISRIDWMVGQVENHEAIALGAIREVQQAAARARVQLGKVRRDGERLRARRAEEAEAGFTWRERARGAAAEDETRALECLRRARRAERRATELARRVEEHERVEKQLAADVARVEERLGELRERHNLLRTRESRAHALAIVRDAGVPLGADAGELFERWETRVTERELAGECASSDAGGGDDAFAAEFDEAEEAESLRSELRELVAGDARGNEETEHG